MCGCVAGWLAGWPSPWLGACGLRKGVLLAMSAATGGRATRDSTACFPAPLTCPAQPRLLACPPTCPPPAGVPPHEEQRRRLAPGVYVRVQGHLENQWASARWPARQEIVADGAMAVRPITDHNGASPGSWVAGWLGG